MDFGAEWFITQGVYASEPISKLLNAYGDLCRSKGIVPKKVRVRACVRWGLYRVTLTFSYLFCRLPR